MYTFSSVAIILVLLTGPQVTRAELISSEKIRSTGDVAAAHCHEETSNNGNKNGAWKLQADSSVESEYDKLQRRPQAELCRQGQLEESCSMWHFKYFDEHPASGFEVQVVEESLDRRLANRIYTSIATKLFVPDFFRVSGENPKEMEQNFRSLEGAQVNAEQCTWQLEQMAAQLDELEARLTVKRQNSSFRLELDERHIRLAHAMDSYSRYEPGLLQGRSLSEGSYRQCQSSRLLLPPTHQSSELGQDLVSPELVKTRFCWAFMELSKHRSASLTARQTDSFEASQHPLQLGVCLPESCHTRSFLEPQARVNGANDATLSSNQQERNRELLQRLIDSQFKLPSSLYIDESLPLHSVYCLADEQSAYKAPLSGQLALTFLVVWLLLALLATYYQETRYKRHASNRRKKNDDDDANEGLEATSVIESNFVDNYKWFQEMVDCMNLKKSWQDFVGEQYDHPVGSGGASGQLQQPAQFERPHSRVNLDTLNPIKVFGCMFVVLGHALICTSMHSLDSLTSFNQYENDPVLLSMLTGTLIVDTFFVITGTIMGYVAMSKSANLVANKQATQASERQREAQREAHLKPVVVVFVKHWLRNVLSRYLRLAPLLYIIFWLKRTVLVYHVNFGKPFADNGFNKDTLIGACKHESWWTPLGMMQAFMPLSQQCLPHTWSVAADLFYTITLTPLLLIMTKRPKLALMLGSAVCLLSWMWSIKMHLSIAGHKAAEIVHLRAHGLSLMFGSLSYLGTHPLVRICSILAGLLTGYAIHVYDTNRGFEWPSWMRGLATKLSFGLIAAVPVVAIHIQELKKLLAGYEHYLFASLFTTGRVCWALANGVLMARMTTDWRNSFLMRQSANKFWATITRLNLAILLVHLDVLLYYTSSALLADYLTYRNMILLFSAAYVTCIPLAIFMHTVYENPINKLAKRHFLSLL